MKIKKSEITNQQIAPVGYKRPANGLDSKRLKEMQSILPDTEGKQTKLDGIREKVFLDRYSLKDAEGKPTEFSPEDMWSRVAAGIAGQEKTQELKKYWAQKFYQAMYDFKFVPGGRILSGAGTGYEVTFFNCYVIPSPKDSRGGIMQNITHTVEIQARGGGVGINLSSLRPNGARVRKVNGTSSGPVSWAKLYSAANHDVIQQGGSRRGALMLMLHDWHPDLVEFIHAKEDGVSIPGANLSVCVSDKFMEALENDAEWTTRFPDTSDPEYDELWDGDIEKWEKMGKPVKVYDTFKAKDIWDQICKTAWASAEPGLHFLERSNKWGNTWYFEKLLSTNPSLRAGTKVLTKKGIFPIEKLEDQKFYVKSLDGQWSLAKCFLSGKDKPLYKIVLNSRKEIYATAEHKWPVSLIGGGFGKVTTDKLQAGNILPFPQADDIKFEEKSKLSKDQGFMIGWLYGDGWISERKKDGVKSLVNSDVLPKVDSSEMRYYASAETVIGGDGLANLVYRHTLMSDNIKIPPFIKAKRLRSDSEKAFGFLFSKEDRPMAGVVMREINKLKREESGLKKASGNTYTIQTTSREFAVNLLKIFGIDKKENGLPESVWTSGGEFIKGFIDGLFSSDGFVSKKTRRIVFTTKHKKLAEDVADLLSFYGVKSHIKKQESTMVKFPNGKNYYKTYERYDITIDGYHAINFAKIFPLSHPRKQANLEKITEFVASRKLPDEGLIRIVSVEKTELKEDVWDVSVFDETHCFYINHCITGNCGEQPLGEWAVCNLGAMNLSAFVRDDGEFDYEKLDETVRVAMRFMDNVVDANYYFLKENEIKAKEIRRTGIGTMGLADALIKMKLRYGAEEALPTIEKIYQTIRDASYDVSSDLAKEKGSFPKFDAKKYLMGHFIKQLPKKIQDKIGKQGIRNAVILTQAPTGTTSLLAGVSSGIEPVFDFKFIRKDRIGEHVIYHPLFQEWKNQNPEVEERPGYFVGANDLSPMDHIKVQALIQNYTDSSISKTANAPFEYTVEQVKDLYMQAYKLGCKGVTFFRDGSRGGVLYHESPSTKTPQDSKNATEVPVPTPAPTPVHRPMILRGRTYKIQTPVGEGFITINRDENDQPFEVFINIAKGGTHVLADAEAMGRLISMTLRLARNSGPQDPEMIALKIVSQLRNIGGASSIGFGKDRVMSLGDAIAKALAEDLALNNEEHKPAEMVPLNLTEAPSEDTKRDDVVGSAQPLPLTLPIQTESKHMDICPECGQSTLVLEEGCSKCYSCGFSKC